MRRFGDFEAFPKHYHGRGAGGTPEAPGFHTASNPETTLPYAALKISDILPSSWDRETRQIIREEGLDNAAVVIEIDMAGFEPYPDVDAEYALDNLSTFLEDFTREADPDYDLYEQFYDYVEQWGSSDIDESDPPDDIVDLLFRITGPTPDSIAYSVRNMLEALSRDRANEVLARVVQGRADPTLTMHAIGQYRYLLDVPSKRIVAVSILKPWFNRVFPSWDDQEYPEKVVHSIEKAGFVTVNMEDYYDRSAPHDYVLGWNAVEPEPPEPGENYCSTRQERTPRSRFRVPWQDIGPYKQLYFEGMEPLPRIEYHGTSLINLCLAAPELVELAKNIPPPFNAERFYKRLENEQNLLERLREE